MSLTNARQLHFRGAGISEAEPALIGLAGRGQLLPHVRDVLQALLDFCTSGLELRISETLTEFEKQLVRLADKATIHQQNEYFGSVHALQRSRADVVPRFLRSVENSLARLGEDIEPSFNARVTKSSTLNLALTDSIQMDESVVLSDIATKVEMRVREPLFALGRRFGALSGAPPLAVEIMPLGPRSIVEALRYGTSALDLIDEHRLVLYRCFERVVMNQIGSLYVVLNNCLIERGILPHLHTLSTGNDTAATAFPRSPAKLPTHGVSRVGGGDAGSTPASSGTRPISAPIRLATRSDFFGTLRQLLGECRRAETYTATSDDLQAVLTALQVRQPVASVVEGTPLLRSAEEIKQEILALLHERCAQGRAPRISEEDSDAIDLTVMLFDFLSRQTQPDGVANRVLVKLQLPILRAAIKDKSFFSDETHCARRLLNEFVEAAQFWIDENEAHADNTLVDKLQLLTDHIACAYQGDATAFAMASKELSQHIAELVLRGEEAAEQSLMEAAASRKKRASEELAAAAIGERIARARPNEFVRALLECVWTDVLTVTLLREGEGSAGYRRRLDVVDQLLAAVPTKGSGSGESLPPDMRAEIESGLTQAGLPDEDIRAITKRLFARADDDRQENPISQTELAIKLKARRGGNQKAASESLKGRASEIEALQKLAYEIASRQARINSGEQESLVDKAWIAIRNTLSNFSGRKQSSPHPIPLWTARRADQTLRPLMVQKEPPQPLEARTLLLVDDEVSITRALTRVLRADGYRILCAASAAEAMEVLSQNEVQVIIADQRMPHVSGTQFLAEAKAIRPNTVRILLSGYSDAVSVTDAINRGTIYKFLTKPWDDDDIRLQVRDAFQACELH